MTRKPKGGIGDRPRQLAEGDGTESIQKAPAGPELPQHDVDTVAMPGSVFKRNLRRALITMVAIVTFLASVAGIMSYADEFLYKPKIRVIIHGSIPDPGHDRSLAMISISNLGLAPAKNVKITIDAKNGSVMLLDPVLSHWAVFDANNKPPDNAWGERDLTPSFEYYLLPRNGYITVLFPLQARSRIDRSRIRVSTMDAVLDPRTFRTDDFPDISNQ